MDENITHEGMLKHEVIQFFIRKHWIHLLKLIVFALAIGLLIILFFLMFGTMLAFFQITVFYSFFAFLVIIVSIFCINIFFLQIFNYYFDLVIVTDHRIICSRKTVFLKNDNDAIDLTKIQDIGVKAHGILRNYLNYGAMIITLSMAAPPVIISCIPNPHYYLEKTNHVKRENILRRQERRGLESPSAQTKSMEYLQDIDKL